MEQRQVKDYPSIPKKFEEFNAYVFDKLDGSNLRFEWSRKKHWYKYGTRTRLFDQTDTVFGPAIPMFLSQLSEPLERVAVDNRWESCIVFAEYWSPNSLGGVHADEPHLLSVFDVAPFKQGILGPKDFLDLLTDKVPTPAFLGRLKWTRGFVERVYEGDVEGVTFEGVVGKAKDGKHDLVMAKAKTKGWIEAIMARHGETEGKKLVDS
jgi:hypothetical protein